MSWGLQWHHLPTCPPIRPSVHMQNFESWVESYKSLNKTQIQYIMKILPVFSSYVPKSKFVLRNPYMILLEHLLMKIDEMDILFQSKLSFWFNTPLGLELYLFKLRKGASITRFVGRLVCNCLKWHHWTIIWKSKSSNTNLSVCTCECIY